MSKDTKEFRVVCHVGQGGKSVLRCPNCNATRKVDTTYKDYAQKSFIASCKCGAKIECKFEFRNYYRRKVRLSGFYHNKKSGSRGNIIVENISLMGIGFICLRKHDIKKGDQLDITYTLDNHMKSKVTFWTKVVNSPRFGGISISAVKL